MPALHDPTERLATFQRFIEAVEEGERLGEACKRAGTVWGAVSRWITDDRNLMEDGATFAARYQRARLTSASYYEDRAQEAIETATVEDVQVAKLRAEGYRWHAKVRNPKGYGDKVEHEVGGSVALLHLDALRQPPAISATATHLALPASDAPSLPIEASSDDP